MSFDGEGEATLEGGVGYDDAGKHTYVERGEEEENPKWRRGRWRGEGPGGDSYCKLFSNDDIRPLFEVRGTEWSSVVCVAAASAPRA